MHNRSFGYQLAHGQCQFYMILVINWVSIVLHHAIPQKHVFFLFSLDNLFEIFAIKTLFKMCSSPLLGLWLPFTFTNWTKSLQITDQ